MKRPEREGRDRWMSPGEKKAKGWGDLIKEKGFTSLPDSERRTSRK